MKHTQEYIEARQILEHSTLYRRFNSSERLDAIRHLATVLYIGCLYPVTVIN